MNLQLLRPRRVLSRLPAGISLTEMLIAMALLATLTAGGLSAYARTSAAYHAASVEQRLHERAQYVFATLEPELQMAGYFAAGTGLQSPPLSLPGAVLVCGPDLVGRLDRAVEAHARYDLPCAAQGAGAVAGSGALVVRRVSARLAAPAAGRAQWLSQLAAPAEGRLLWDGALPPGMTLDPPQVELRDLLVRVYYVARAADGDVTTPALRMKSLTSIAGTPTFVDTEVMPGIAGLQISVYPSGNAPQSVRVTLQVRADQSDLRNGAAAHALSFTRHFALRNALAQP